MTIFYHTAHLSNVNMNGWQDNSVSDLRLQGTLNSTIIYSNKGRDDWQHWQSSISLHSSLWEVEGDITKSKAMRQCHIRCNKGQIRCKENNPQHISALTWIANITEELTLCLKGPLLLNLKCQLKILKILVKQSHIDKLMSNWWTMPFKVDAVDKVSLRPHQFPKVCSIADNHS